MDAKIQRRFAEFKTGHHLMLMLRVMLPRMRHRLPRSVYAAPAGTWAVSLEDLGCKTKAEIDHLLAVDGSLNTGMTLSNKLDPSLEAVPLADAIRGPWETLDVFRMLQNGVNEQDIPSPVHPDVQFLLGAATPLQSERIFRSLIAHRSREIELCPVPVIADLPPDSPCRHFWKVAGCPPLSTLQLATRAWWGVPDYAHHGNLSLYQQWPYRLCEEAIHWRNNLPFVLPGPMTPVKLDALQLFWDAPLHDGDGEQILLIGRDDPQRLLLRIPAGVAPLAPLHEIVAIESEDVPEIVPLVVANETTQCLAFPLRMQLIDDPKGPTLAQLKIRQLEEEIERAQQERDRLLDELNSADVVEFEPPRELLIFYRSAPTKLDGPLQRLILEQCDQASTMHQLRYATLDPMGIDDRAAGDVIHAITTARGLDSAAPCSELAPALRNYFPLAAGPTVFEMLPEWERHGLHLFIQHDPRRRRLDLYPDLKCGTRGNAEYGPEAAALLARALGVPDGEMADWLVLLIPDGPAGALRACRVARAAFGPLIDRLRWTLNIDVRHNEIQLRQRERELHAALESRLIDGLIVATQKDRDARCDAVRQQIQPLLEADGKAADERRAGAAKLRQALDEEERAARAVAEVAARVHKAARDLDHRRVRQMSKDAQLTADQVKRLAELQQQLTQLRGASRTLRREYARLLKEARKHLR